MYINESMALRMVRYRKILRKLKSVGMINVFSNNLADALGVTAAVVRKDFFELEMRGNKRGGYKIEALLTDMDKYLGKGESRKVVVIGCGRLGKALIAHRELPKEDIRIVAGFDISSDKIDKEATTPILPMEELAAFVKREQIEVGIIAVPESAAHKVFDRMLEAGMRGVLNMSPVELKCGADRAEDLGGCTVRTVNVGLEIENLFCFLKLGVR